MNRLPIGTSVIPTEPSGSTDWIDPQRKDAKWGVKGIGTIVDYRKTVSHGLVYKVRHESGGEAWYEPEELNFLSEPCKVDSSTAGFPAKPNDLEPSRVRKAIEQEKELDEQLKKVTYTTELPQEGHLIALLAYRCPHCNKLNEMIVQPGPISLKRRCLHCDSWYEYTPTKE